MNSWMKVSTSSPGFVVDPETAVRSGGRQVDWNNVPDSYRSSAVLVKLNGAAAADATSITVDALLGDVPPNTLLHFGQSKEFAKTTALALKGATTIPVEALPSALEDNDEAYYGGNGPKVIKAATLMAELSGGKIIPRAAVTGAETTSHILQETATEDAYGRPSNHALTGYGTYIGGAFFKEMMPDKGHANFNTWIGELNTAGPGVRLETYSDSRAS